MEQRQREATYVAETIAAFPDGSSSERDSDDFTSCSLDNQKLDDIRRQALAVDLPVDDEGQALLNQLRVETGQANDGALDRASYSCGSRVTRVGAASGNGGKQALYSS